MKVADFGIAHIESSKLTQVGTVLGTPNYMSPEQILGLPVDGRSDLFAAGVILYQFLTGERPFSGSATTTVQKVLKEDPLPPSISTSRCCPRFDAIVRRALAKRPEDRFTDCRRIRRGAARRGEREVGGRRRKRRWSFAATPGALPGSPTAAKAERITVLPPSAATRRRRRAGDAAERPAATKSPVRCRDRRRRCAVAIGAGVWFWLLARARRRRGGRGAGRARHGRRTAPAPAGDDTADVRARGDGAPPSPAEPGTMLISAVGVIDPPIRATQRTRRCGKPSCAGGSQEPARREGAAACSSIRSRSRGTTTRSTISCSSQERDLHHARRSRRASRSSARTAC